MCNIGTYMRQVCATRRALFLVLFCVLRDLGLMEDTGDYCRSPSNTPYLCLQSQVYRLAGFSQAYQVVPLVVEKPRYSPLNFAAVRSLNESYFMRPPAAALFVTSNLEALEFEVGRRGEGEGAGD